MRDANRRRVGGQVGYGTSDLPHLITGDVSTGAMAIQLGYRLLF